MIRAAYCCAGICSNAQSYSGLLIIVSVLWCGWLISVAAGISSIACQSSLTQNRCAAKKQFIELDVEKSPCPRCRGGLGLGAVGCNGRNTRRKCAPGLKCVKTQCVLDKSTCAYSHHLRNLRNVPECKTECTFAEKQCKGDMLYGRCFCNDELGNRIFGFSWRIDAHAMNCACSRRRARLESSGQRADNDEVVTLHCAANGNYEPLQCQSGICWCVNVNTGRPMSEWRAVPQSMWKALPCYDAAEMGDQYGRQCESIQIAQQQILSAMRRRGTTNVAVHRASCNYAGAYGSFKIENGIAACITPVGKRIESYQELAMRIPQPNCNCAMDRVLFAALGSQSQLACTSNGNYNPLQSIDGRTSFCVDSDGFPISDFRNSSTTQLSDCLNLMWSTK